MSPAPPRGGGQAARRPAQPSPARGVGRASRRRTSARVTEPYAARRAGAPVLRLPVRSAGGLLDGLLRGRVWVACVGVLLVGIVFLNVSLLGLNSGIAVTADQAAELRRQNADLRLEVAKLGSSERIQRVAESRGFVMPAPGAVTYLEADPDADGRTAVRALGKAASRTAAGETQALADSVPEGATTAASPAVPPVTADVPGEAPGVAGDAPEAPVTAGAPSPPPAEAPAPPADVPPPEPPAG